MDERRVGERGARLAGAAQPEAEPESGVSNPMVYGQDDSEAPHAYAGEQRIRTVVLLGCADVYCLARNKIAVAVFLPRPFSFRFSFDAA